MAGGEIIALRSISHLDFNALLLPGGFGAAKNLNHWAVNGPDGAIDHEVKARILDFIAAKKPIGAMCMGPTVVAKALEGSEFSVQLTVGLTTAPSPYEISAISAGMENLGAHAVMYLKLKLRLILHLKLLLLSAMMMEAGITDVWLNTQALVSVVLELIS